MNFLDSPMVSASASGGSGANFYLLQDPPTDPDTYIDYTVNRTAFGAVALPAATHDVSSLVPAGTKALLMAARINSNVGASAGSVFLYYYPANLAYGGVEMRCRFANNTDSEDQTLIVQLDPATLSFKSETLISGLNGGYEIQMYTIGYFL